MHKVEWDFTKPGCHNHIRTYHLKFFSTFENRQGSYIKITIHLNIELEYHLPISKETPGCSVSFKRDPYLFCQFLKRLLSILLNNVENITV